MMLPGSCMMPPGNPACLTATPGSMSHSQLLEPRLPLPHAAGLRPHAGLQFLSRPFVVGDRIDVTTSGGARVLTGYVERVDPMRTIMRSDAGLPYMLPNKVGPLSLPWHLGWHLHPVQGTGATGPQLQMVEGVEILACACCRVRCSTVTYGSVLLPCSTVSKSPDMCPPNSGAGPGV